MYEDVLYPKEVPEVMRAVLDGSWRGPDPETYIDSLIGEFFRKNVLDRRQWAAQVATAVKQLGCIDCVMARLNLECLLEADEGDKITIRYDRQRLLPGENHGVGCPCKACMYRNLEAQVNRQLGAPEAKPQLPAPPGDPGPPKHMPECGCKECVDRLLAMKADGWNLPYAKEAVLARAVQSGYTAPMPLPQASPPPAALSPQEQEEKDARVARARTGDYSVPGEAGPDGEPVVGYPEDQEALDELEASFYAQEKVIKHDLPRPSLDPERKAEILAALRMAGYDVVETREKAWERLEKLLKRRSLEQSITARLAYLVVFSAFQGLDSKRFFGAVMPNRLLPFKQ